MDKAILLRAAREGVDLHINATRQKYVPFEPATKRSEGFFEENGHTLRVIKGTSQIVAAFLPRENAEFLQAEKDLAARGLRVLAIASESEGNYQLAGLIGLLDPPRRDSKDWIARIKALGVRVVMITGDGLLTARAIASEIGIGDQACTGEDIHNAHWNSGNGCEVYAEVLPEDKFNLVRKYQGAGLTVGMTGDGVNDAPGQPANAFVRHACLQWTRHDLFGA